MDSYFTIGKLANCSGLSPSAIRYYERSGLIEPVARTDGNYRVFSEESLQRLRFIQAAKVAGFTLDDISKLIHIREESGSPCSEVQKVVGERRFELQRKLEDLQSASEILDDFLGRCTGSRSKKRCVVLEKLQMAETSS